MAILFADLSGSTAMADRLDAETSYGIITNYLTGLGRIITEGGGYVVKTLGDGVMALFGAPAAHGDDPVRAARTALRMQEWMREYGAQVNAAHGVALTCRIGINYGSVVATPTQVGSRPTYDVLGDAVNVAQRVESAAEAGTICVTDALYRLTRGTFEYVACGAATVKGKAQPLQLYRLVGPRSDADGAGDHSLPFVGREEEAGRLVELIRGLRDCRGGVLAIAGEGGMGKSRLLEEAAAEIVAHGIPCLHGVVAEEGRYMPLVMWRTWLNELLPVQPGMDHAAATEQIRAALTDPEDAAWAPWLAALAVAPEQLNSIDAQARELFVRRAIRVFLDYWQEGRPAALLVDEAGHLDTLSLRILIDAAQGRLAGSPEDAPCPPLLVLLAAREGPYYPPEDVPRMVLGPLTQEAVRKLIERTLGGPALPQAIQDRLTEIAGGCPLFLDLMLRSAREAPDPVAALTNVPDSLYGVVRAQVDALVLEERGVAEKAAVLGRVFEEDWLSGLWTRSVEASATRASRKATPRSIVPWRTLETREILVEHHPHPDRALMFRLGAVAEVLYEGLLKRQRQIEHSRAALVMEQAAAGREALAVKAAWHWERAENWEQALKWTLRAADLAAALYAGDEAVDLYQRCLQIAEHLDTGGETSPLLARASFGLAGVRAHQGDYPAAQELYGEAESRLGEPAETDAAGRVLLGRIWLEQARVRARVGAVTSARPYLELALDLLAKTEAAEARRTYVQCLVEQTHEHCEQGLWDAAAAAGERALGLAEAAGWSAETISAGSALGRAYQALGRRDDAESLLTRAAGLAEQTGDWQGAASCWINLGTGLQAAGRYEEATEAYNHSLDEARRIADVEKIALISLNLGTVHLSRGLWDAAEEHYRKALEQFRRMDHQLGVAVVLCNLADTLQWAGRTEEVTPLLDEADRALREIDAGWIGIHGLVTRAELELVRGDAGGGARLARRALARAEELEYDLGIRLSRLTLGRALRRRGELAAAENELRLAAESFEAAGEPLEAARSRMELAVVLALSGDDEEEARDLYDEETRRIQELGSDPWLRRLPQLPETEPATRR